MDFLRLVDSMLCFLEHSRTVVEFDHREPRYFSCWVLYVVAQSCPTLWDPIDCSLPGFSVHGDSPGKNTGVGCHALLQGIFPTRGPNPGLLHCRQILYCLSHQGSPRCFPYQPSKESCSMWSRSPSTRVHETSFRNANLSMFPGKKFLQWLLVCRRCRKVF